MGHVRESQAGPRGFNLSVGVVHHCLCCGYRRGNHRTKRYLPCISLFEWDLAIYAIVGGGAPPGNLHGCNIATGFHYLWLYWSGFVATFIISKLSEYSRIPVITFQFTAFCMVLYKAYQYCYGRHIVNGRIFQSKFSTSKLINTLFRDSILYFIVCALFLLIFGTNVDNLPLDSLHYLPQQRLSFHCQTYVFMFMSMWLRANEWSTTAHPYKYTKWVDDRSSQYLWKQSFVQPSCWECLVMEYISRGGTGWSKLWLSNYIPTWSRHSTYDCDGLSLLGPHFDLETGESFSDHTKAIAGRRLYEGTISPRYINVKAESREVWIPSHWLLVEAAFELIPLPILNLEPVFKQITQNLSSMS